LHDAHPRAREHAVHAPKNSYQLPGVEALLARHQIQIRACSTNCLSHSGNEQRLNAPREAGASTCRRPVVRTAILSSIQTHPSSSSTADLEQKLSSDGDLIAQLASLLAKHDPRRRAFAERPASPGGRTPAVRVSKGPTNGRRQTDSPAEAEGLLADI
jgi:hypothetical protein